ncbi:MAG: efflux RND transporter periplasmic adaptor subunit [Sandaracinaceae bacterium]|nr:efflux RND transporter periplasmic adaptor subunit [Sandaracinaceae bacterium]
MRPAAFMVLWGVVASCSPPPVPLEPEPAPAATSASARWVPVQSPGDASLLSAPAVVRAPAASAEVSAPVRVRVVALRATPGSLVAAGDPIVEVAAPELAEAAADFARASEGAREHERRATELEALRAEGLVSRSQVFEVAARAAELAAERERASATLRSAGLDARAAHALLRSGTVALRAPVAGVVAALDARLGETRDPSGAPLARIVGEGAARIEVRTTNAWPSARAAWLETADGLAVPLAPAPLASVVEAGDGTRVAWFEPDPPLVLPDGMTGTVTMEPAEAWEVPLGAVGQRTGVSEVLRRRGEATERVRVIVLATSGATALVRGPLTEGDEVAASAPAGGPR